MTYSGPPNHAERTRNDGRKDYTRSSFEFGYDGHQEMAIANGAGIRRRKGVNPQGALQNQHHQAQGIQRRRN